MLTGSIEIGFVTPIAVKFCGDHDVRLVLVPGYCSETSDQPPPERKHEKNVTHDEDRSASCAHGRNVRCEDGRPHLRVGVAGEDASEVRHGEVGRVGRKLVVLVASRIGNELEHVRKRLVGIATAERAETPVGLNRRESRAMSVVRLSDDGGLARS